MTTIRPRSAFRRSALPVLVLASATAVALAGCSTPAPDGASDEISIVATSSQVADFTRQILGGDVEVYQMLPAGAGAHSYDPSASDLVALGEADVLVINGVGLEEWLDSAVTASGFDGIVIDSSAEVELSGEAHEHEEGEDHAEEDDHDHADGDHTEDDHAEDDHADHDHAEGDPHIWTSVHNAEHMVEHIAHELAEADADNAATYEANAEAYLAQLEDLDAWIRAGIDAVPEADRLLVTNHEAMTYFNEEYGVTFVGAIIPSFDDNAEASAAEIDALVAEIRTSGARAVFSETSISPSAAETIAAEAGVAVYSGEDALYVDSLGPVGSAGESYLSAQIHNVRQLIDSWGATAPELPASLADLAGVR